jgi:hypothetical protein
MVFSDFLHDVALKIKNSLVEVNPVPSDLGINYFKYQKDIINSYNRYTLPKKFNKHLKD